MATADPAAPEMPAIPAPRLRFLQDGDVAVFHDMGESIHVWLLDSGNEARLSGRLAEAVRNLLAGKKNASPALNALCRWHSWLRDVIASEKRPQDPSRLLLGDGLEVLFIELTEQCNERCLHCYAEAEPARKGTLAPAEVDNLLAEAAAMGCASVQFTGGDPLLYPHLQEAVATARRLGFADIEIYTNGLKLSPSLLARLAPFQPSFAFSIYSHDAAVHDAITRTCGSHGRTLTAIRRCLEAGLAVRIGVIVMAENAGQEAETRRYLMEKLGISAQQIGFDTVKGTGRGSFFDYALEELEEVEEAGDAMEAATRGRRGKLCVAADGTVYPCIFSRRTRLGNIREASLAQIIHDLKDHQLPPPDPARWRQCHQGLTCADCQIITYVLGEGEVYERQVA